MLIRLLYKMVPILLLCVLWASSALAVDQINAPHSANEDAKYQSTPAVINVGSVTNCAPRRGPKGEPGPAGPAGPQGTPGFVQIIERSASCPAGNKENRDMNWGPIAAALVAGLFGLIGLVISKENKTSDFRQAWIDALRGDIADFLASAKAFAFYDDLRHKETDRTHELEYEKLLKDVFDRLTHAQMRIRLRINSEDKNAELLQKNKALLSAVESIRADLSDQNYDDANAKLANLHKSAGPVLKAEWERVKRGETPYIVAKWLAAGLILVGSIASLVALANSAA